MIMPLTMEVVPVSISHEVPSASLTSQGRGSGGSSDDGLGSGLVRLTTNPGVFLDGSASQITACFNPGLLKQGSWISLPSMHRQTPVRATAIESVQHSPLRLGPVGTVGWNTVTSVF